MYKPIQPFEIMEARHSVRQYKDQAIEAEKRAELERIGTSKTLQNALREYRTHGKRRVLGGLLRHQYFGLLDALYSRH